MRSRTASIVEPAGHPVKWFGTCLIFILALAAASQASASGFRWSWTCDWAEESIEDRQEYFEALQGTALLMIDKNFTQTNRPDYVDNYGAYLCKDGVCIQSLMEELSEYERIYADMPVVPLEWQEFAVIDLGRFRSILEGRRSLKILTRRLHDSADGLTLASNNIELVALGTAMRTGGTEDDVRRILEAIEDVQTFGFVVVDGDKDLNGNTVKLDDGRFYLDINRDIRDVLKQLPYFRDNPECVNQNRLFQVYAAGTALIAQFDMMYQSVREEAPILDIKVQTALGMKTLGEAIETDLDLETFRGYMREAFPQLRNNLSTFASRIHQMTVEDVNELARMPMVRAAVLGSTGDHFKQLDCIINSETPWDELFYSVAYTVGGVAGVVTMIAVPESAPLVLAALSWVMIPVAALDTLRLWNEYKDAKTGHFVSVFRPGILSRAKMEESRLAFWVSVFGLTLDAVLTPFETVSLIKSRTARLAARSNDPHLEVLFPNKDPLDGIPMEQRIGMDKIAEGETIKGAYWGNTNLSVEDFDLRFWEDYEKREFREKHHDAVFKMFWEPWRVPDELLQDNNKGLYQAMQEMTIGFGDEFGAFRYIDDNGFIVDQNIYLIRGTEDAVYIPRHGRVFAHTHPNGGTSMSVTLKKQGGKLIVDPESGGDINVSWYRIPKNPDVLETIITPENVYTYRVPVLGRIPVWTTYGFVEVDTLNLP